MRRFLCLLLLGLCLAPLGFAQSPALDEIFQAVDELRSDQLTHWADFQEAGAWMSVVVSQSGQIAPMMEGTQWIGLVFELETGERVAWEDLFEDGDAAAARIEEIAEASLYLNAYAEYNQISPVPRDSFALTVNTLTVYYPATQLSYFSGRSGAFSFYAYELADLLREGVPLKAGDPAEAKQAMATAFAEGSLPGSLADWTLGSAMADAKDALGLVDVPDLTYDYAVYRFEAPQMRGVSLLSLPEEDSADTAVVAGIFAERMDFSGLITGITSKEDCIAALGAPSMEALVETADAYSRLPMGETIIWTEADRALELHFVDNVLYSVALLLN